MGIEVHRRVTQSLGAVLGHGYLAVFATRAIYQGPLKGLCVPFLSCYACPTAIVSCPIGTLQHFFAAGAFPWLVAGTLVVVGALVGRMACGWLCPFGLTQELLYRLPTSKIVVPPALANLKYVVLAGLVVLLPLATRVSWFSQLCPAGTLFAGLPWVLWNPLGESGRPAVGGAPGLLFAAKVGILVTLLALFVAAKRPFCRTLCPLGAIFSLFARVSLVRLRVAPACRRCNRCRSGCPVDQAVWEDPNSGECVRCLACTRCRHVTVGLASIGRGPAPLPRAAMERAHGD